jgi:hypothetical protein
MCTNNGLASVQQHGECIRNALSAVSLDEEIANDCHLNITDTNITENYISYQFLQDIESKISGQM